MEHVRQALSLQMAGVPDAETCRWTDDEGRKVFSRTQLLRLSRRRSPSVSLSVQTSDSIVKRAAPSASMNSRTLQIGRKATKVRRRRPLSARETRTSRMRRLQAMRATQGEAGDFADMAKQKPASPLPPRPKSAPRRRSAKWHSSSAHPRRPKAGRDTKPTYFLCDAKGDYRDLDRALKERGWRPVGKARAATADLLWTVSDARPSPNGNSQIRNHFQGTRCLTTKDGLSKILKDLHWTASVDRRQFYPDTFDLGREEQRAEFAEQYELTRALQMLSLPSTSEEDIDAEEIAQLKWALRTAFMYGIGKGVDDDTCIPSSAVEGAVKYSDLNVQMMSIDATSLQPPSLPIIESILALTSTDSNAAIASANRKHLCEEMKVLAAFIMRIHPQIACNLEYNAWIVKPAQSSKAVGLELHNSLESILRRGAAMGARIVQRYIERPLLLNGRKFDVRVWVLVTSWDPLQAYVYTSPYARLCSAGYDMKGSFKDGWREEFKFSHFTNWALQKHYKKTGENTGGRCNDADICWSVAKVAQYIYGKQSVEQFASSKEMWESTIWKGMVAGIRASLQSAKGHVAERTNSFELFGFDFIIDTMLKPWLLEVNLSPGLNHRNPLLSSLIRDMMEGLAEIAIDPLLSTGKASVNALEENPQSVDGVESGETFSKGTKSHVSKRRKASPCLCCHHCW